MGQTPSQRLVMQVRDGLNEGEGHVLADDRGHLEEALVLFW